MSVHQCVHRSISHQSIRLPVAVSTVTYLNISQAFINPAIRQIINPGLAPDSSAHHHPMTPVCACMRARVCVCVCLHAPLHRELYLDNHIDIWWYLSPPFIPTQIRLCHMFSPFTMRTQSHTAADSHLSFPVAKAEFISERQRNVIRPDALKSCLFPHHIRRY